MDTTKNENVFLMECMATALIQLLKDKPFSSISITEITQKAGVSRMTYYRNYKSKEQVLEKYLDWIMEDYHRTVLAHGMHASYIRYENILIGFMYFKKYNELMKCLIENNMRGYLQDEIINSELALSLNSTKDWKDRYMVIAYANALVGIFVAWVQGGMAEDPKQLSQMICDVYQEKIRRY